MIRRFPREQAFLERTHLRYVHLANILTDSKVDRAARVPGFVAVFLGDETELIFLVNGEPVTAARLAAGARGVLPVAAVVERARVEVERADVAYYGAAEPQLRAMFASASLPGEALPPEADLGNPRRFFEVLRQIGFEGVLELIEDDTVHYLIFERGQPADGYIADHMEGVPLREEVVRLFDRTRRGRLAASLFPSIPVLPVQAPKALVDLYARTVGDALQQTSRHAGMQAALEAFESAFVQVSARHPALDGYRLSPEGKVLGRTASAAEPLADGVAAWLFEALVSAQQHGGGEPSEVLAEITRDTRFVLQAQGFFRRLPWPVAW
jgi:hypothetical protein